MAEKKKEIKNITIGVIISWIFGAYLLLNGIFLLFSYKIFFGILQLLGGILIIPLTNNYFSKKHNFRISGGLKVLIFLLVILIIPFIVSYYKIFVLEDYSSSDLDYGTDEVSSQSTRYFSGYGQEATESFYLERGLARFKIKNSGSGHFSIWLMDSKGNNLDLLVNEIGSFDGSKATKVPKSGYYLLDVDADSSWSITVS